MRLALVAALAIAMGCAGSLVNPAPITAPFVESEYEPFAVTGTGSISGQTFMKTRGGDVKFGAGNDVHLDPVTAYSIEWYAWVAMGPFYAAAVDPRTGQYRRTTIADGEGRFRFKDLPSGEYFLSCTITWETGGGMTGGSAIARVVIHDGEQLEGVVVTQRTIPRRPNAPTAGKQRKFGK